MKAKIDFFKINGQPMFAPDENMDVSFEDIDASDSGRDESGVMHRVVVQCKVGSWSFVYSHITEAELNYMLSLFPTAANGTFNFTHPKMGASTETETTPAYCSKYGIVWHSAVTKDYRNFKFNIIQCKGVSPC